MFPGALWCSPVLSGALRCSPELSGALRCSPELSGALRSSPELSGALPGAPGLSPALPDRRGPSRTSKQPDFSKASQKNIFFRKSGFRNSANRFVYSVKDRRLARDGGLESETDFRIPARKLPMAIRILIPVGISLRLTN